MISVVIQTDPIDAARIIAEAGTDADGAVVSFIGRARNASRGKTVTHLEYEIYTDMAYRLVRKMAEDASARWSLSTCSIVLRHGRVDIGETSILIAASSPHRDAAFRAVTYLIDAIKEKVPIWKKEFYTDGSEWIDEHE